MPGAPAGPQLEVGTPAWGSVKCIPQVTPRLDEMTPLPSFKRDDLVPAGMLEKRQDSILTLSKH